MSSAMNIGAVDSWMREMYALPGTQLKQWVVDLRRASAWERETCPLVLSPAHNDNTGAECRNSGAAQWFHLDHDCCDACCDLRRSAPRPRRRRDLGPLPRAADAARAADQRGLQMTRIVILGGP